MKNAVCFISILLLLLFFTCSFKDTPPDGTYQGKVELINNQDYLPRVLDLIGSAQSSVFIIMYAMKYEEANSAYKANDLIKDLVQAYKKGVDVKILLDDITAGDYPQTTNYLKQNGMHFKIDPPSITTHSKMIVIDGNISIIGSHNWTESAVADNNETSVILYSSEIAEKENEYFYTLYNKY